jgi:hypothetical protein
LGYRQFEKDKKDIPTGYKVTSKNDPYPVEVFSEKTIPDTKIGEYLNSEFYYYLNIYKNIKSFGLPYPNSWLDNPHWLLSLVFLFDDIGIEYEKYKKIKSLI